MIWVLIFIKKLVLILKKLMIGHRFQDIQSSNRCKKLKYHDFFLFFLVVKVISFFLFILFFLLLALNIFLLYVTNTNSFSSSFNPKDLIHKLSSANTTIFLSKLAHVDKNSCWQYSIIFFFITININIFWDGMIIKS